MKLRNSIGWAFLLSAISIFGYIVYWVLNLGSANAPGDGGPNFIPLFILGGGILIALICALTGWILVSSSRGHSTEKINRDEPE